jgi:hypothetical protein
MNVVRSIILLSSILGLLIILGLIFRGEPETPPVNLSEFLEVPPSLNNTTEVQVPKKPSKQIKFYGTVYYNQSLNLQGLINGSFECDLKAPEDQMTIAGKKIKLQPGKYTLVTDLIGPFSYNGSLLKASGMSNQVTLGGLFFEEENVEFILPEVEVSSFTGQIHVDRILLNITSGDLIIEQHLSIKFLQGDVLGLSGFTGKIIVKPDIQRITFVGHASSFYANLTLGDGLEYKIS